MRIIFECKFFLSCQCCTYILRINYPKYNPIVSCYGSPVWQQRQERSQYAISFLPFCHFNPRMMFYRIFASQGQLHNQSGRTDWNEGGREGDSNGNGTNDRRHPVQKHTFALLHVRIRRTERNTKHLPFTHKVDLRILMRRSCSHDRAFIAKKQNVEESFGGVAVVHDDGLVQ